MNNYGNTHHTFFINTTFLFVISVVQNCTLDIQKKGKDLLCNIFNRRFTFNKNDTLSFFYKNGIYSIESISEFIFSKK